MTLDLIRNMISRIDNQKARDFSLDCSIIIWYILVH